MRAMILSLLLFKLQERTLRLRNQPCGLFPFLRLGLYLSGCTQSGWFQESAQQGDCG
jgi:hypothetical protein